MMTMLGIIVFVVVLLATIWWVLTHCADENGN